MPFLSASQLARRLQRGHDWANNQLTDGPLVMLNVPPSADVRESLQQRYAMPSADDAVGLRQWWTDADYIIKRFEAGNEAMLFLGDAWPCHFVNLGPGALAGYMGCESVLQPTTIWQEPLIEEWGSAPELKLQEDSWLWKVTQELTRASIAASGGRWVTTVTDIGGAMDIASAFRTPEKLCFDLLDNPKEVAACEEAALKAWFKVFDRLAGWLLDQSGGTASWGNTWARGRHYMLQCDFCCMIGPDMFRQFVRPVLGRMAAGLDASCYHLDGPGSIRHLDDICSIPGINCIQWVPGAGNSYGAAEWIDLYRRIQDNGCGIWMWCTEDELDIVFDKLDVDRLMLTMHTPDWTAFSPTSAESVMRKVERLRKSRRRAV